MKHLQDKKYKDLSDKWQKFTQQADLIFKSMAQPDNQENYKEFTATNQELKTKYDSVSPIGEDLAYVEQMSDHLSGDLRVVDECTEKFNAKAFYVDVKRLRYEGAELADKFMRILKKRGDDAMHDQVGKEFSRINPKLDALFSELKKNDFQLREQLVKKQRRMQAAQHYLEDVEAGKQGWNEIYNLVKENLRTAGAGIICIQVMIGAAYIFGLFGLQGYLTYMKYAGIEDIALASVRFAIPSLLLFGMFIVYLYFVSQHQTQKVNRYPGMLMRAVLSIRQLVTGKVSFAFAMLFIPVLLAGATGVVTQSFHKNNLNVELADNRILDECFDSFIVAGDYYIFRTDGPKTKQVSDDGLINRCSQDNHDGGLMGWIFKKHDLVIYPISDVACIRAQDDPADAGHGTNTIVGCSNLASDEHSDENLIAENKLLKDENLALRHQQILSDSEHVYRYMHAYAQDFQSARNTGCDYKPCKSSAGSEPSGLEQIDSLLDQIEHNHEMIQDQLKGTSEHLRNSITFQVLIDQIELCYKTKNTIDKLKQLSKAMFKEDLSYSVCFDEVKEAADFAMNKLGEDKYFQQMAASIPIFKEVLEQEKNK